MTTLGFVATTILVGGCRATYQEVVVATDNPVQALLLQFEEMTVLTLPETEHADFLDAVERMQVNSNYGVMAIGTIDDAEAALRDCRLSLGFDVPQGLSDPANREWRRRNAQASLEFALERVKETQAQLRPCIECLDWWVPAFAVYEANHPHGSEVTDYGKKIVAMDDTASKFQEAWISLIRLPMDDATQLVTKADTTNEFAVVGAITAAQEKLDFVLESLASLTGRKIVFPE